MAKWYVVRIRGGRQERATQELIDAGVDFYHPKMRREIKHHQKKVWFMKEFPLFTGYVFASLGPADFCKLRDIREVLGILGDGDGCPIPVADAVVEGIREAEAKGNFDVLRPKKHRLRPGMMIEVKDGFLAGHTAAITDMVGKRAIRTVVNLLGTSREVEIPLDNVRMVA